MKKENVFKNLIASCKKGLFELNIFSENRLSLTDEKFVELYPIPNWLDKCKTCEFEVEFIQAYGNLHQNQVKILVISDLLNETVLLFGSDKIINLFIDNSNRYLPELYTSAFIALMDGIQTNFPDTDTSQLVPELIFDNKTFQDFKSVLTNKIILSRFLDFVFYYYFVKLFEPISTLRNITYTEAFTEFSDLKRSSLTGFKLKYKESSPYIEFLYKELKGKFISKDTFFATFNGIFSEKPSHKLKVKWVGYKSDLSRFISLLRKKGFIECSDRFVYTITQNCFIDGNGDVFDISKFKNQKPTKKFKELEGILEKNNNLFPTK